MKCHRCNSPECYRGGKVCYPDNGFKLSNSIDEKFLKVACDIEREFYGQKTRIEEVVEFSKRMGFKRIGVAFCIGLFEEAKFICKVFERSSFEVFSVACKVGSIDKSEFGIEKIKPDSHEAICSPILQAKVLNEKETELNLIVGLCVGHDILFQKYSKAPTTTLVVKDRVLAHNPLGAVYSNYYKRKLL